MPSTLVAQLLLPVVLGMGAVPWLVALGARLGAGLAVAAVLSGLLVTLLGTLVLSAAVGTTVTAGVVALAVVVAVTGVVACVRGRARLRVPSRAARAIWLPALVGAAGWLAIGGASRVVPGAASLSWVMNGDTFNNLVFARGVVADGGVLVGGGQNPVPLPAGVLALALAPFGPESSVGSHLQRDIESFAVIWTVLLAVGAVVMGAVVASAIPRERVRSTAVVSALGSLLPLTWFAGGLPVQWGYLNVHLALPLALSCWLVHRESRRHPVAALTILFLAATALLATWTPLVVLPAAFGVSIIVRHRVLLRSLPTRATLVLLVGFVPLALWAIFSTAPAFSTQGAAFGIEGHGFPPTWGALIVVVVLTCLAGWRIARDGALAIVAAAVAGSVAIVFLARDQVDPLVSYYPSKFAWLLTVVVGAIALALVVGWVSRRWSGALGSVLAGIAVVGTLVVCVALPLPGSGGWAGEQATGVWGRQPAVRILSGAVWNDGDETAARIFDYATPGDLALEWGSDDPDQAILDFWVLVTSAGGIGGDQAVTAVAFDAYRSYRATGTWDPGGVESLCIVLERMPSPVTVHTSDPALEGEIAATCETEPRAVVLERG